MYHVLGKTHDEMEMYVYYGVSTGRSLAFGFFRIGTTSAHDCSQMIDVDDSYQTENQCLCNPSESNLGVDYVEISFGPTSCTDEK